MDLPDRHDSDEVDIKVLVEQYEEALANNRQPLIDQDSIEEIVDYYENEGHFDKALRIMDAALEQHPYSGTILLKKAQVLFDLKICEDSLECLDQAAIFDPGELGIPLLRSEILTFQSLHEEAIHVLDHAMELAGEEEESEVWLHMADVYEDWEKYDEVYRCLYRCLLADMENEEALSRINYAMELTAQYEDAVRLHRLIINEHPFNFWAWYNLSVAYAALNFFEKAIDALEYVVAINEEVGYAHRDLAQYRHELGHYEAALADIAEYCGKVKPDADIFLLEGKCHFELGNVRASRYSFRKAIRANGAAHEAYYNLGMTYVRAERWVQAIQHLRKAVELNPDQLDYLERLAEVALQLEEYDEVKYCCTRAIHLNTRYVRVYITLALSHLFNEESDEALHAIDRGINACDNSLHLRYIRAGLLMLLNKRKAGILEMESLLEESSAGLKVLFQYFPFLEEDGAVQELIQRFDISR